MPIWMLRLEPQQPQQPAATQQARIVSPCPCFSPPSRRSKYLAQASARLRRPRYRRIETRLAVVPAVAASECCPRSRARRLAGAATRLRAPPCAHSAPRALVSWACAQEPARRAGDGGVALGGGQTGALTDSRASYRQGRVSSWHVVSCRGVSRYAVSNQSLVIARSHKRKLPSPPFCKACSTLRSYGCVSATRTVA
jgi:hypothetical protein